MPDHSGLRGTDVGQDTRFKDKEAASIKATKFPANFSEKVDLRKVNISVLKPWIAKKVIELIRVEDDIVVEFVFSMLEDKDKPLPDPKKMQVSLLGFMDKYGAAAFMEELWTLLLSAQSSTGGIPAAFLEAKKAEIQSRQSDTMRFGASYPAGRPDAASLFDEKPRVNDAYVPGRSGQGRDGGYRNDRDRDNGYGQRGPPRRYDDRPPRDRGYERERDSGYGNRARRSPSPRRDRERDERERYGGGRDRDERDTQSRRRPTPPRRPSPPPRRRSPSPRRRSPSPPPRRRERERERERSDTPPARKSREEPKPSKETKKRDDTPPMRRARSPSRSESPPARHKARRARSPSRTPTPSDPGGRSRSPTVTPPRKGKSSRKRDDSTPPRRRRSPSDSRSPSSSPRPRKRRNEDEGEGDSPVKTKGRGSFAVADREAEKAAAVVEKPKKKLEGALGKSRWADDD